MIESVRARLALWHTAVVATLLIAFAGAAYAFLSDTIDRRVDRFLEESGRAFAADLSAERADEATNENAVRATVAEFHFRDLSFVVYDAQGRLKGASLAPDATTRGGDDTEPALDTARVREAVLGAGDARDALRAARGPAHFATAPDREGGARVFVLPVTLAGELMTVVAAQSLHDEAELLEQLRNAMLVIIPLVLVGAWAGGYALAKRSLAPVVAMSDRAAAIGAASLGDRLPVANPRDELGQLAATFNGLLERMAAAFDQQRRFMSDASHELRTPVAIMRGEADVALSRDDRGAEEYRDALRIVRDEGRRLSGIVNDLFLLARADAGQQPLRTADLYLDDLLGDCARAMRSLAAQRDVTLEFAMPEADGRGGDWSLRGDEELLRRLFLNLLDNAIKYSGAGESVRIAVAVEHGAYRVIVSDTGVGIPVESRPRVFERFYRAEAARSRADGSESGGGAGLGLAIARWIAEAHGGTLTLDETAAAPGSTFVVTLPLPTGARVDLAWTDRPETVVAS